MFQAYLNPSIRHLKYALTARAFGAFANNFLLFAIPLLVFKITNDAGWSGYAYFVEWCARLISLAFAGYLILRIGFWFSLFSSDTIRAVACISTVLFIGQYESVSALILLSIINGFLFDLSFICVENICQRNATKSDLPHLQALIQLIDQSAFLGAPLLAGIIVFVATPSDIILIAAGCYLLSLFMVTLQKWRSNIIVTHSAPRKFMSGALKEIFSRPILICLILEANAINLMFGSVLILNPAIVTSVFSLSDSHLAYANAFFGVVGTLCIVLAPYLIRRSPVMFGQFCVFLSLVCGLLIGFLEISFMGYLLFAGLIIGLDSAFSVYLRIKRASAVSSDVFERIIPFMMLFNALAFPISGVLVGILSEYLEETHIFPAISLLSMVLFLIAVKVSKQSGAQYAQKAAMDN